MVKNSNKGIWVKFVIVSKQAISLSKLKTMIYNMFLPELSLYTMASYCIECSETVRPRQEAVQCNDCEKWQHRKCGTGIDRDMYRRIVKGDETFTWFFTNCTPKPSSESTRLSLPYLDQNCSQPEIVTMNQSTEQPDQSADRPALVSDHSDCDSPDVNVSSFNVSVSYV